MEAIRIYDIYVMIQKLNTFYITFNKFNKSLKIFKFMSCDI